MLCLHPVTCLVVLVILDNFPSASSCFLATSASATIIHCTSLDAPIEDIVVLIIFMNEEISEELVKVRVVQLIIEVQCTSIVEEDTELIGEATTEEISGCGHLL